MTLESLRRDIAARVPPGAVVVALSGGADSAVAGWALSDRDGVEAVTIDHGLPGSSALAAAAAAIASRLGLPHRVIPVSPRSASETDLRAARLAALEGAGEGWIVTGHTADDLAETVLGNLLRGAGPAGLAGIPVRRDRYVRPLLDLGRADTRRIASELGLAFVDDPQNDDLTIRRNRIRHQTLPQLAETYNPNLRDALLRTARAAAADDAVIESRAALVPLRRDEEAVLIPGAALSALPPAVAARVARRALRLLRGPDGGDAAAISSVLAAAVDGRRQSLVGGLEVMREGPWVAVVGPPPPPPGAVEVGEAGPVAFGPWRITAGWGGVAVPAGLPLAIRAARPSDRIALRTGTKPVGEALAEAGVPERLRRRWPVVEWRGRIVWVVGVRTAPPGGETLAMSATKESR